MRSCGRSRSGVDAPAARAAGAAVAGWHRAAAPARLFALLQQPPVARRFGLDDEALAQVHDWLRDAGFHWALDAQHRASFERAGDAAPHAGRCAAAPVPRLRAAAAGTANPSPDCSAPAMPKARDALALGAFWRFADGAAAAACRMLQRADAARSLGRGAVRAARRLRAPPDDELDDAARAAPDDRASLRRHARRRRDRRPAAGGAARGIAAAAGRPGARRRGRRQHELRLDEQPAQPALRGGLRHRPERRRLSQRRNGRWSST